MMGGKKRRGVMLYFDTLALTERLSLEDRGRLFNAILEYGRDGVPPDFRGNEGLFFIWPIVQMRIDADGVAYETKCRLASRSAKSRWNGPEGWSDDMD